VQEAPSEIERIIMSSTLCTNLVRIRQLMKDLGGDSDACIEVLIASQGQDEDEDGDAAKAGAGPSAAAAVPPTAATASAVAPSPAATSSAGTSSSRAAASEVARPQMKWSCEVCTFWNGAWC
jgi:hypothetical protein